MPHSPRILLLLGVAGSGKSTVGRRLAEELGWPYFEADDFHSPANKAKMSRGVPLDDEDRRPWLAAIRATIDETLASGRNGVFTCSGLKEKYRRVLLDGAPGVIPVYLAGDLETILARVRAREGHFMKADLVRSQFEALEPPRDAVTVDIRQPLEALVAEIKRRCL
ncbi:MAG: gluconokinase [Opitutaceae bacterium]|nr:gluconokinase [Opitutaceae bacterium]